MVRDSHPIVRIAPRHLLEASITAGTVSAPQAGILLHQRTMAGHKAVDTVCCTGRRTVRFAVFCTVDLRQRDIDGIHAAGTEGRDGEIYVARDAHSALYGRTDVETCRTFDAFDIIGVCQ